MYYSNKLEDMLKDGYSRKYAKYYLEILQQEKESNLFSPEFVDWAHSLGFFASSAAYYNINDQNVDDYLSEYEYYRLWPINNWSRIWINDKLTLKYMLNGTPYSNYMPKYYFYSNPQNLIKLMDVNDDSSDIQVLFLSTLKKVGNFACKPNNGSLSKGFFKLSYNRDGYFINNVTAKEIDIINFVKEHPNYIFTEYITPNQIFKKYSELIHTIRLVTINPNGNNPQIVSGCIRFANNNCSVSNYISNNDSYNLYTFFDISNGTFSHSIIEYPNRIHHTTVHPDNNIKIEGALPKYQALKNDILGISNYFNNIEYMGFDIGFTDNGYKIMEINSHPGIITCQTLSPYFKDEIFGSWLQKKIQAINLLSDEGKKVRNNIER